MSSTGEPPTLSPEVIVPETEPHTEPLPQSTPWASYACLIVGIASALVSIARFAIEGSPGATTAIKTMPLWIACAFAIVSVARHEKRYITVAIGLVTGAVGAFLGWPLAIIAAVFVIIVIQMVLS